ncbi:MAG: hypothetical protein PUB99_01315, partial [Oscillospiraceae bacterium]|nr:hypothetical protein [Oscillospiraceae bacterium]
KSAGGEPKQSGGLFWRGEPSPGVPRCEAQIPQFSVKNVLFYEEKNVLLLILPADSGMIKL